LFYKREFSVRDATWPFNPRFKAQAFKLETMKRESCKVIPFWDAARAISEKSKPLRTVAVVNPITGENLLDLTKAAPGLVSKVQSEGMGIIEERQTQCE
jgi:hypothetical protein